MLPRRSDFSTSERYSHCEIKGKIGPFEASFGKSKQAERTGRTQAPITQKYPLVEKEMRNAMFLYVPTHEAYRLAPYRALTLMMMMPLCVQSWVRQLAQLALYRLRTLASWLVLLPRRLNRSLLIHSQVAMLVLSEMLAHMDHMMRGAPVAI